VAETWEELMRIHAAALERLAQAGDGDKSQMVLAYQRLAGSTRVWLWPRGARHGGAATFGAR
jgi:hypothetical protein